MRDEPYVNAPSLTAEQREALRQRLVKKNLIDSTQHEGAQTFICEARDRQTIVSLVPGGESNLEGIYPLTSLQEGLLYHHMLAGDADPYLRHQIVHFTSRDALDRFVLALCKVVERHAVLRTAVLWEGLAMPLQVVLRAVELPILELQAPVQGASDQWLTDQLGPEHRIDISTAPLMKGLFARSNSGGWSLLILSHHLVGDRTSLRLMQDELSLIMAGDEARLPIVNQFPDYAVKVWALGTQRDEAFFRERLGDLREPTAPLGLLDAVDARAVLGEARTVLDASLVTRLRELTRRHGVGIPAILHVAWTLVLSRLSGVQDVVFGTVLSGRMNDRARTSNMLGMLVNTLPFRLNLLSLDVSQSLIQAQRLLGELVEHEHAPFSLARRCSGVEGSGALTGALLDYRYLPASSVAPLAERSEDDLVSERTSFPLVLTVDDSGQALVLKVQTLADLQPERVALYCEQALEQLAVAVEHAPYRAVSDLQVIPEEQMARLVPSNGRVDDFLLARDSVHGLFEAQVARTPRAPCLISDAETIDYLELDTRASRLATHLRNLGLRAEDRIALCLPRGIEMIVAMLAVMKSGGAYVPLDPGYPQARLRLLIRLARPALVLSGAEGAELARELGLAHVDLRQLERWSGTQDVDAPSSLPRVSAQQAAYIMFTSGSTGEPKGVTVEHRNVVTFMRAHARWCRLGEEDRVLHFASPSFDNAIAEIFPALSVGAAIVVRPDGPVAPDDAFVRYLARHRVTVVDLPTAFWHLWAQQVATGDQGCLPRPPLRLILAGGEKLQHDALRDWFKASGTQEIRLGDSYGLTETTVNSIMGELTADHARSERTLPLGNALDNSRTYILDRYGRLAPQGLAAEICIGGAGVARGYLDRPALTAARFLPDPYGPPGTRLYCTGDIGRRNRDAQFEYVCRNDKQIKLRGYRIEPEEVESTLRGVGGVRDAKVIADQQRLIAYIICEDGAALDSERLRAGLCEVLPAYMVPALYLEVARWPVNTHGKIDISALPSPDVNRSDEPMSLVSLTPMQSLLAGVWRELLERDVFGVDDDFFALGGHSLLAIRVVSRVRSLTQVALSVRDVFAYPLLKDFALALERAKPQEERVIKRQGGPARLSFAQERLWFLSRLDRRQSLAYHLSGGLRIRGALDSAALRAAFAEVVERHEVLRTVFIEERGVVQPVVVSADEGFNWRVEAIAIEENAELHVAKLFAHAAQRPFDLACGPLIDATLLQLAADEHVLLVTMHHIISDGWSMSLLASELSGLYGHFAHGDMYPLMPMTLQYSDYALWQRETMVVHDEDLRYWRKHMAGAPACLKLPAQRARPAIQDPAGKCLTFTLDCALTAALRELGRRHGVTLYMILLGAYAVLLDRLAGQTSVVIGTPVANRTTLELEGLIGCFVNTLPLHIRLGDKPSVAQLLARIKQLTIDAQERQHVPFEQIVDAVRPVRDRAYNPLFQAMLVWQNTPTAKFRLEGLEISEVHPQIQTTQCDLALMMEERTDEVGGTWVYATALFDEDTVADFLQTFKCVLVALVEERNLFSDASSGLASDRLLRAHDVAAMIPSSSSACLHDCVSHWARMTPNAVAIEEGSRQLGYLELDASANQLARYLRSRGVGAGSHVAVAMSKSIELVIAIVAILKAGGAYVPLETQSVKGRMLEIIEDSQPLLVIIDDEGRQALAGESDAAWLDYHMEHAAWGGLAAHGLDVEIAGAAAAYVIYTSGSTGRPKGVVVEHAQVRSLLDVLVGTIGALQDDVWSLFHSIAFDFSVWELFGGLRAGSKVLMVPAALTRIPGELYRWLCERRVTVFSQTPGAFAQIVEEHLRAPRAHSLRQVIFGGEQLDPALLRGWFDADAAGQTQFIDMYGITEGTIHTTWHRLSEDDTQPWAQRSVGKAISGRHVYVLDEQLQPAGNGILGEIWIAGEGVARGYYRLPALTAERFVPDPFSARSGARMYRSGDLGRLLDNGELEYAGRADEQVNVRGFRVELGEVSARLAMHPAVGQAHVVALASASGGIRLVAYYRLGQPDEVPPSPIAFREYLSGILPAYMVPVAYVQIAQFPLTVNGKVDVKVLPMPASEDFSRRLYEPAINDTESWLVATWSQLLAVDDISRHDDFFELGGHSLLVGQLVARIRDKFDIEVSMGDIFDIPVLHAFAARLDELSCDEFETFDF
ncbi:amino acid adenylation enzyme/thioester reductase family protein [Pseudomonas asplenii]|uniref:Amino acid adenylation enzyme/thioester reductase family protein n=1 Tax=Pseudomonas asplenii TaxID=53407 RepID=A0A0M9GG31_9PSED|nr:non-ribosomal peptide synthetase [Pseudomonas fuscovaginae]KPA90317.1 amino acid adenylation enzyme/thioester reductase family protein [Pseudomonas fuscovaginae]